MEAAAAPAGGGATNAGGSGAVQAQNHPYAAMAPGAYAAQAAASPQQAAHHAAAHAHAAAAHAAHVQHAQAAHAAQQAAYLHAQGALNGAGAMGHQTSMGHHTMHPAAAAAAHHAAHAHHAGLAHAHTAPTHAHGGPHPAHAAHAGGVPPFSERPFPVVRLRGLPYDATENDVAAFFQGLDVVDVVMLWRGQRLTGEAFVLLPNTVQADFALQRSRQNMGRRYIEVFSAKKQDYYAACQAALALSRGEVVGAGGAGANAGDDAQAGGVRAGGGGGGGGAGGAAGSGQGGHGGGRGNGSQRVEAEHTGVLKMRGLPFTTTKGEIIEFFDAFAGSLTEDNIHIRVQQDGRATGEAFVEFASVEESQAAMVCNRKDLTSGANTRYVELFVSSREEATRYAIRHAQ